MSTYALPRRRNAAVLADLLPGSVARDALLVVGAAGFVGLLAQISVHLSFTPVPITGQTLGVLLAGTALGWRRGALAMVLYGAVGLLGVPWFANGEHGYVAANFGYVLGFVFSAAACGRLAELRADRSLARAIPAMIVGSLVTYAFGIGWLAGDLHVTLGKAFELGMRPFLWGDAIKAAIAALMLPGVWKLAGRR